MHKAAVALAILIALGASLTLFGNTAHAGTFEYYVKTCFVLDKCQQKLGAGTFYQCDVEQYYNRPDVFSQCFQVDATGEEIFHINNFLWRDWDCQCDSTGDPGEADFNDSPKKFVCAGVVELDMCDGWCPQGDGRSEIGGAFRADVSRGGKDLTFIGVGSFHGYSHSFVATCEKVTSCSD